MVQDENILHCLFWTVAVILWCEFVSKLQLLICKEWQQDEGTPDGIIQIIAAVFHYETVSRWNF